MIQIHFTECALALVNNHQWRIAAHPSGQIHPADFQWHVEPVPPVQENQVLVRVLYLSLDPSDRVMAQALPLGALMLGLGIGQVEQSNHPSFQVGDLVQGMLGWQTYYLGDAAGLTPLPNLAGLPLAAYLAVFGIIGPTAYVGLLDIAQPRAGETLVVSAAAGAVGSLVGQLGKIAGCRVVGITGSDDKARWITETLGFDGAVNYKDGHLKAQLELLCPQGIDIYFDNVGGDILDTALAMLRPHARIVLCGFISQYNALDSIQGPANFYGLITQRARAQGFIIWDHLDRFDEAYTQIGRWLAEGKIRYRVDMVKGLEHAPSAMGRLFDGTNQGKLIVSVAEEPAL